MTKKNLYDKNPLPFLHQLIHNRPTLKQVFRFHQQNFIRTYFINNFNHETYNIDLIMGNIEARVKHASLDGYTKKSDINITFVYNNKGVFSSKSFNSFCIINVKHFRRTLE